jgi:hypothetical protein
MLTSIYGTQDTDKPTLSLISRIYLVGICGLLVNSYLQVQRRVLVYDYMQSWNSYISHNPVEWSCGFIITYEAGVRVDYMIVFAHYNY